MYRGQEYTITRETGFDLTGQAGNIQLDVRSPSGVESSFVPTIVPPEDEGVIEYTFGVGDLDEVGDWLIKPFLIAQAQSGRQYVLSVIDRWDNTGVPSVPEIREYLNGYCLTECKMPNLWISKRRDVVIRWLETVTRLPIGRTAEFTEYVSGTDSGLIWLSRKPVNQLVSLQYVISPGVFSPSISAVELISEEGVLKAKPNLEEGRNPIFPSGKYNIRVTYEAGADTVPEDIYEAIMALTCEKILASMGARDGGGPSRSVGGYTRNYGNMGKYGDARKELARWGLRLCKKYMTGVVAG